MRLWLLLAACLCACGDDDRSAIDGGLDAGPDVAAVDVGPREAVDFRVVTWNVENFFDSRNDPDTFDDVLSASEVEQKMEDMARVLLAIDADFVALQEVENEPLLQRFVEGPLAPLGYTDFGLIDSFDGRGIDVAYVSRVPITNVVSHLGEDFDGPTGMSQFFSRDALEVFAEPGGIPVLLMVLHLRSMLDDEPDRRLGEAMQAKRIVDRRISVSDLQRIMVLGDFNDFPDSEPLDAFLGDEVLSDLTQRISMGNRWSYEYRGNRQQLDYMLSTATLESEAAAVEFVHGSDVDLASDHQPLVANFRLTP